LETSERPIKKLRLDPTDSEWGAGTGLIQ
jgi:hypothetical protein